MKSYRGSEPEKISRRTVPVLLVSFIFLYVFTNQLFAQQENSCPTYVQIHLEGSVFRHVEYSQLLLHRIATEGSQHSAVLGN